MIPASGTLEAAKRRRAEPMTPPAGTSVERGGQCSAHTEVMVEIAKIQSEVGHMRSNFDSVTESCEKLTAKIDELAAKVTSPDISKTWILGVFGIVGTLMTVCSGVLVAAITNADKLSKLIGWGG